VTARPDTFGYRSAKFLGRHRITAGVSLLAPVGVAGGVGLALLLGGSARVPRVSQVVQITQTGRVEVGDAIVTDGSRLFFTERAGGHWSLSQVSAQGGATQPLPLPPALSFPEILDISPDHSQLLMTCQLGTGDDRPLWVIPIQGGPPRRLGDLMGSAGAWSADGRSIVFSRGTALFQANAEGRDCRKIADTPGQPDCIRWSPLSGDDVIRFALLSLEGRARILWQIHADGSGMHPLLRDWRTGAGWPDSDDSGTWIAGGKYYLYRSRRGSVSSVWARREPQRWWGGFGGRPAQIYSTPQELAYLAPAPDGKRVFFGAGQERRELMRYDPVRGQFLPFLPGVSGRFVAFSKDGRWIAYTTFREGALWRSRTDGSERLRLTPEGLAVSRPQWSPDGSWIAVAAGPTARILMIPAAGGAAQNITTAAFQETSPAWSADGGSLLFLRFASAGADGRKGLYVMDWKTRHTRFLPGSESMSLPAWSPDPRYIAASSSGTQISICDLQSGRWTKLAEGAGLSGPTWSRDGKYVYYQDVLGGMEQPVFRVRIRDMKTERVFSLSQIPQSNLTGYGLAGLDPTEAPIVSLIRANADIYALELDLP
jgi:Tol biopolymer transport system component